MNESVLQPSCLAETLPTAVTTSADRVTVSQKLEDDEPFRPNWRDAFDKVIDLYKTRREEEEGIEWPTNEACSEVTEWLFLLKSQGYPPPDRIAPDGDGGARLEWAGDASATIAIDAMGASEILLFRQHRLVRRVAITN